MKYTLNKVIESTVYWRDVMRKKSIACVLTAMMTLSLAACGNKAANNSNNSDSDQKGNFKVAMVTDTGGINDQSFNQSTWEGLEAVKAQYGAEISYLESVQEADYASNLDKMVDQGNDLVWGVGFSIADAINNTATMNSEKLFGIIDHSYGDATPENVVCVMFRAQEASFLVGYAAGMTTTTNQVGFVGGIASDILDQFEYGYRAGVAYAAAERGTDIQVSVQYLESFSDAAKGKATATKMYSAGCDIVFHAAGNAGTGVIEAAKDANKFVIGVDRDQSDLAPQNVLTSALKLVGDAVQRVCQDVIAGKTVGGQTLEFGLTENSVGIPTENPNMAPEVYDATMKVQQDIIDGKISVPMNAETFAEFEAGL